MSYTLNNPPTIERISNTSLKLTWDKPKNAQSYAIWRKKHDGAYQKVASGVTETAYTDIGLKAETRYYYYVVSTNATNSTVYPDCASKERAYSTYMVAPTLTVNGQNSITLEWKQNDSDMTYDTFDIYRKVNNTGGFEKIDSVAWSKTSYTDKKLTENTTCEYYVKVVGDGYSVPSLTSKAVTDAKRSLISVEISSRPDKVIYEIGEAWDGAGLSVRATYSDNASEILTSGFTVAGFDSSSVGTKTVTVTYQGKSAAFTVSVREKNTDNPGVAQLVIGGQSASPGGKVTVPVSLKNNPGVVGFSFAIEYDTEKLEYLGAADGNFSGLADNVSVEGNQLGFAYSSASDVNLSGETIVKLTFQAKSGAKGTAKLLLVMDEDFGDSFRAFHSETQTIAPVNVDTQDGEITIADFIPGDVNGSGRVDNDDLILLTRYRARWKVTINMDAADVNGSGKVDNDDLILLTRYRARWKVMLLPGKVSAG